MVDLELAYKVLRTKLREKRYIHTLGVISVAKKLAKENGVSSLKAEIAALSHDIAKNMKKEDMIKLIKEEGLILTREEEMNIDLWHGILAPIVARKELNIEDKEILDAIRYHTTGREDMTKLDKIIYIADIIEPSRVFEGVDKIRIAVMEDLDKGILMGLDYAISFLISKNSVLDINTIRARNFLIMEQKNSSTKKRESFG